jgi:hypothetical protein
MQAGLEFHKGVEKILSKLADGYIVVLLYC